MVELCFNPFSLKNSDFQNSKFASTFKDSICDPITDESEGYAYLVDSDIDRNDEVAVMKYLREKYNAPKLQKIDLGWHSGSIIYKNSQQDVSADPQTARARRTPRYAQR